MPRALPIVLAALVGAGLAGPAAWIAASRRADGFEARVRDAEEAAAAARRETTDWEQLALRERERRALADEEAERLRELRVARTGPADDLAPPPAPHAERGDDLGPSTWDDERLRIEIQRLATLDVARMARSPLLAACADATRRLGEPAFARLLDVLNTDRMPGNLWCAAALILERLEDERAVPALRARLAAHPGEPVDRIILRALANLPGDAQCADLLAVWNDLSADARLRMFAIHGLAKHGADAAIALVEGTSHDQNPAFRARAIESLHGRVRASGYADASLAPVFASALLNADGEGQQRLALVALEGLWDRACVAPLRTFAALPDAPADLRERARAAADAIDAGEPRPADAGTARSRARPAPPAATDDGDDAAAPAGDEHR